MKQIANCKLQLKQTNGKCLIKKLEVSVTCSNDLCWKKQKVIATVKRNRFYKIWLTSQTPKKRSFPKQENIFL